MEVIQPYLQDGWQEDWRRELEEKKRKRGWKERLNCLVLRMRKIGRHSEDDGGEEGDDEEDQQREDALIRGERREVEIDVQVENIVDRVDKIGQWKERSEEKEKTDGTGKHLKAKTYSYYAPDSPEHKEEEFNDARENLLNKQEDSTDDDDTGVSCSTEVDVESLGKTQVKVYTRHSHPTDIFHTLTEFRDSLVLTDLTLSTEDGRMSCQVHAPVLAAVSSLVRDTLRQRIHAKSGEGGKREVPGDETEPEVQSWSLSLGPEVDIVGLQAVLEFAYSGDVAGLSGGTVARVQAAALSLGVPRVLELCHRETQQKTQTSKNRNSQAEGVKDCAAEQMEISLQALNVLRLEKGGCDVVLEAVGASLPGE